MTTDDVRIAYVLQVFKHPEQVNLLLRQLLSSDPTADLYVHVDQKSTGAMSRSLIRDPRITVLKTSLDVGWGDITAVDASLLLFREVVSSGKPYDFVILRSGQDLLVRKGLKEFLAKHRGKSFLAGAHVPRGDRFSALADLKWPRRTRARYDSAHPFRILRSLLIRLHGLGIKPTENPDRLPDSVRLYRGSAWFCLSMPHVRFVLDYLDGHPWYYRAFENALVPDEWFYQTLLMNSAVAGDLVNWDLLYSRWGTTKADRNHPVVLTVDDIPSIEETDGYFARKFDIEVDRGVVEYFVGKMDAGRPGLSPASAEAS
ncbi:MAG TPA: beta-1,6-N-acetylglucosaminyltransferase [Myxococcales bacterium]